MYFQQADLLRGMGKEFLKQFMDNTVKETHRKGYFLFREGNRATHFYILLKGRVKLTIGDTGHTVYTIDHPGEAFGWSSLLGREVYSASAECRESTKLLRIDVKKLQGILEKDPANGLIFFKHLSAALGNRLLQTYRMVSTASQMGISPSFGTGDVLESETMLA
jgi:CRP-like cAMP-binding protein